MAGKFENWPPDVPEKEGREGCQSELEAEEAAAAGEMEVKLVHGAGKRRAVGSAFLDLRYGRVCPVHEPLRPRQLPHYRQAVLRGTDFVFRVGSENDV